VNKKGKRRVASSLLRPIPSVLISTNRELLPRTWAKNRGVGGVGTRIRLGPPPPSENKNQLANQPKKQSNTGRPKISIRISKQPPL